MIVLSAQAIPQKAAHQLLWSPLQCSLMQLIINALIMWDVCFVLGINTCNDYKAHHQQQRSVFVCHFGWLDLLFVDCCLWWLILSSPPSLTLVLKDR